jgi:ABC-type uncharacterized transport system involved in gliding motility auxiliary subunit
MASFDRKKLAIGGLVLAGVLFVSLNTFSALSLSGKQLDLTASRQYTLSDGTTKLLARLPEPVTLRLYVSKTVRDTNPFLASYAARVRDLLETYAQRSDGKLQVDYIDPEPFSQAEDRAVGFGLQAITLDNGGTTGYFGIAGTNSTDDVDTIPVLSPDREKFLEYDLTRLVYNLANPEKPQVAMISGLPLNGDPASQYHPWQIYTELGQFYDIHWMDGDIASFGKDIKLLVVVFPQKLPEKTLYAIDQFVLGGGKAMIFVDPQSEAAAMRQQQQQMPGPMASDLEPLLEAWGVQMVQGKVVGDPQYARQVQFPSGGQTQIVDYLPWLSLDRTAFADDPAVAQLNRINVETAGILEPLKGATTTFTPLIHSSAQAQEIPVDKVAMYPDPPALLRGFKPGGKELVMAARITGPAKSAFAGDLPKGVEAGKDRLTQSKGPIAVEVVADTDMLDDRSWLASQAAFGQDAQIPVADNASFVANSLDYLNGSEVLAGLRGRQVTMRPFTRIVAIHRRAQEAYQAKEQDLMQKLGTLQDKLSKLQVGGEATAASIVSADQQKEIDGFKSQLLDTREQLRQVQHALQQDIESLRSRVRFLDIAAVPILVAIFAIGLALVRRFRYRRHFDAHA